MNEVRKGTYTTKVEDETGTIVTTEKGFTFQEESGQELGFDLYETDAGHALLFGNQVFFLRYWTDEQLDKASKFFNEAIEKEKASRNESS